jgi:hypothetical protein
MWLEISAALRHRLGRTVPGALFGIRTETSYDAAESAELEQR